MIIQHCEVTMVNAHFSRQVAHLESKEGCPITPGASIRKVFTLNPSAANNKDKRGIALDGHLKVTYRLHYCIHNSFLSVQVPMHI